MRLFLSIALLARAASFACAAAEQITLDGGSKGRIFEGIGAVSAGGTSRLLIDYPEPYRSQILDYLFKPGYGAALQHLKVEMGSDVSAGEGSEPSHMRSKDDHNYTRGYEWWLMEEARKRNPNIILDTLAWGAPGWIGEGKLQSPDMAEYTADFIKGANLFHHLHIDYTGIWNEHDYDAAYVKELHRALERRHIDTKIVCCDLYPGQGKGQWGIADAMTKDPELYNVVDAIGAHYPLDYDKITTTEAAKKLGKPLWSSEDQPNGGAGPVVSRDWEIGGRILAKRYIQNYLEGSMTKTEIWSPITSYYDILCYPNSGLMYANTPWSGHYRVQGAIWATAHTTQFAQPGWQYLDSSSGHLPDEGSYVTLKAPNGKDWSIVLETIDAKEPQSVEFRIAGGLSDGTVHIWETNGKKTFEHVSDATPQNGKFIVAFDPDSLYSLTTTAGQGKGTAHPPGQKPFPAHYREKFKRTAIGRAPRFLSDQDGAFEVRRCQHRKGRCLEQVITRKPIPWVPLPDPYTLSGDASWSDYRIKVHVLLNGSGPVTIIGRIDSADVFQDTAAIWPSGYVLSIQPSGAWTLFSAAYKKPSAVLASGHIALAAQKWHPVELGFQGDRITVRVDGKKLAGLADASHAHGMFAIGTSWNKAQFSNLAVTKIKSR